jgi:hypothetical protein
VYFSSDYYVISEDQVPAKKNEALPVCSKSARPTAHAACPESARPTTHAASHESARPTLMPAKPSPSTASAQIDLADSQSAKSISLVPAAVDASLDDLTLVDRSSEIKKSHYSNQGYTFL